MKYCLLLLLVCVTVQLSVAPPVKQQKKDGEQDDRAEGPDEEEMADVLEYRRYLAEVVQVLESDPEFRAKLEKANEADIRTGKIADQLQFVSHNVRSRLDEIKRAELERLRHLVNKENELKNGLDTDHLKIAEHVDYANARTFEIQDLKKLIAKTTRDLAQADKKRRAEFKEHEMEKKYEEHEKLKHMNDAERQKYEEELRAMKEMQKTHEPVHHPGSKQQLEEVWEEQDHMGTEEFNPRTFFFLHDIDGNGVWDQDEVKALFLKELDKLYAQGAAQDDLLRRAEEMERMREHVFNEADLDKDGLISYEEFLEQTKKPDFQQDEGWQGLDEQQIYTQEEFEAFERRKQEEMQKMVAKGMLPPHPGSIPAHVESFPPQHAQQVPPQAAVPSQVDQVHPQYHQQAPIAVQQSQQPVAVQPNQQSPNLHPQIAENQIPQDFHNNVAPPQQNTQSQQNSQAAQAPVHQDINRNQIPTNEKA